MDNVIARVARALPKNFPKHISEPIFKEMKQIKMKFYKPTLFA